MEQNKNIFDEWRNNNIADNEVYYLSCSELKPLDLILMIV